MADGDAERAAPGIGHNRPPPEPEPKFEIRPCTVSCDWQYEKKTGRPLRPRGVEHYWRLYRDGVLLESFLSKERARDALRARMERAGDV
jgi:hypothetical protein